MVALYSIDMTSTLAQKIVDTSSDILISVSEDLIVELYNATAEQWMGVSQNEAMGMSLFELFAKSHLEVPFSSELLRTHEERRVIKAMYDDSKNNYLCHWHLLPLECEQGNAPLLLKGVVNTDMDGIANNLIQIINCVPGSLYWKDKYGVYLGCNAVMMETAGLNGREDIIGKTDFDLWPDNADKIRENDLQVIQSGETVALEEEVRIPSGELLHFTGVKMPLRDENNEIIGIVGNSLDITKLKKTEQALFVAKEKAEESNKIKTEFINNMEHDIRTPFNGVWGFAKILAERERDPQKREHLQSIANCAKELLDYCDGILDFSRVEHGVIPIVDKSFVLEVLIERVVNIEMIAAKQKNIILEFEHDPAIPPVVMGDAYRLKRILLNLIGNAIKFTGDGAIHVRTALIKKEARSCVIKLEIQDTGIGIPEENQNIIYERFTRGTPSNKGLYKGQGLGLRIVKQFVSELDGQIHLKSEIDKGSIFQVYLPFSLPLVDEVIDEI
jgi:two-component system, OmpR family, aerobic respiration control sensor histidine kinase ArcB